MAVVSRKAKRKQEREDKKRQKNKRQRKEQEPAAPQRSGKAKARVPQGKRPIKPQRGGPSITNKFSEFLAEAASAQDGEPQSVSAEDKEIKALEAKLGLGSSSSNKAESALKKLKKEYSKDGLGDDFVDFLSELDHISEVVKGRPKAAKGAKHSVSAGHDGDDESDGYTESEVDGSDRSEDGRDFGDDMEMDEETRREMELLQAEDAEFLKGMDELPTDESESESEDLAQFYSDEEDEDEEDDDEARANTMRNQKLAAAAADADEASDDSENDAEQEEDEDNSDDSNDKLEVEEESDDEVADDSDKNGDDEQEGQEKKESVVIEEDIYGRPVIKTSDGAKKPYRCMRTDADTKQ